MSFEAIGKRLDRVIWGELLFSIFWITLFGWLTYSGVMLFIGNEMWKEGAPEGVAMFVSFSIAIMVCFTLFGLGMSIHAFQGRRIRTSTADRKEGGHSL